MNIHNFIIRGYLKIDICLFISYTCLLMLMYTTKTISVIIITICAAITTISSLLLFSPSQQIQLIQNGNDYAYDYNAFAYHGKEISQTLNYAQFLPLTSNNQSHQVKVIVNYSVMEPSIVNKNMNAIMQLFASNGTLIKTSSFPNCFIVNSTLVRLNFQLP